MMLRFRHIWIGLLILSLVISGVMILAGTQLIAAHDNITTAPDTLPWCSDEFIRHATDPNGPPTPPPNINDTRAVCQLRTTVYPLPPGRPGIGGSMPAPIDGSPVPMLPTLSPNRADALPSGDDALPYCPEFQTPSLPHPSPTPPPNLGDTRAVCQVRGIDHPITPPPLE
jgi:hypothetical protein